MYVQYLYSTYSTGTSTSINGCILYKYCTCTVVAIVRILVPVYGIYKYSSGYLYCTCTYSTYLSTSTVRLLVQAIVQYSLPILYKYNNLTVDLQYKYSIYVYKYSTSTSTRTYTLLVCWVRVLRTILVLYSH